MSTQARKLANIANAKLSTGPRTEAGKKRASLNALRHGLTGQIIVLPGEDMAAFRAFGENFFTDMRPVGALETQLVQTVVDTQWRLNRFRAHEANLFALGHEEHASDIQTQDESIQTALAAARTLRENTEALKTLSIHEQRLNRLFQSTLKQFFELRKERLNREQDELIAANQIRPHYAAINKVFNPSDFGFVLTTEQFDAKNLVRNATAAARKFESDRLADLADADREKRRVRW